MTRAAIAVCRRAGPRPSPTRTLSTRSPSPLIEPLDQDFNDGARLLPLTPQVGPNFVGFRKPTLDHEAWGRRYFEAAFGRGRPLPYRFGSSVRAWSSCLAFDWGRPECPRRPGRG
jgi:hypothetical protein